MPSRDITPPGPVADRAPAAGIRIAAFMAELAMLALLAVTGERLGTGTPAGELALAILLPVIAGSLWGVWMAPRSPHRVASPLRFCAQAALFAVTALLAGLAGMATWGIAFGVIATVLFALTLKHPEEQ